jgi:hypothetical protein
MFLTKKSLMLMVLLPVLANAQDIVLVEAESFAAKGGWVVDQQFMQQMGSPYLLAHGLGRPVEDASTTVSFPSQGEYHMYVRTRDWAPPYGPGEFQLIIDGTAMDKSFGVDGDGAWAWHYGGPVSITKNEVTVALHDLTGFEGRVDAIVFSSQQDIPLPNAIGEMRSWRNNLLNIPDKSVDEGFYDVVVVGGGLAGICAAVSSARMGMTVALIQDRPKLGGNNSSEVRVHLGGQIELGTWPILGEIVKEMNPPRTADNADEPELFMDDVTLQLVQAESNISLFLSQHVYDVVKSESDTGIITGVIAKHIENNTEHIYRGYLFVDCTGDGTVGFLAGAEFMYGREARSAFDEPLAPETADGMTMGMSNQWVARPAGGPVNFPEVPWALQIPTDRNQQFYEDLKTGDFETRIRGEWFWEGGIPKDKFAQMEEIRDNNFRAVYGYWYWLANHSAAFDKYATWQLVWMAYIGGKRESRRLVGDLVLKEQDLVNHVIYPDASVTATWDIDLHLPNTTNYLDFGEDAFISTAHFTGTDDYPIPYRCLYSRNINNLFMAGRDISVTHVALGKVRVMRTTGMMGEVVGRAAHLARLYQTLPRGVYEDHLDELKEWFAKSAVWEGEYDALPDSIVNPPVRIASVPFAKNASIHVSSAGNGRPVLNILLNNRQFVAAELRSVSGQALKTIVHAHLFQGHHAVPVDLHRFSKGVYLICVDIGSVRLVQKLVL